MSPDCKTKKSDTQVVSDTSKRDIYEESVEAKVRRKLKKYWLQTAELPLSFWHQFSLAGPPS